MSNPNSQQKSPKCSTWVQFQKWQNDLSSFPMQTIQYHSNPSLCPNHSPKQAEVEWFCIDTVQQLTVYSLEANSWGFKWQSCWNFGQTIYNWESQGRGSLVGCRLWGRTELDTTEVT